MQSSRKITSVILALLFPLTLFGYGTIAPLLNKFAPEGSAASITFRLLVLALCFGSVLYHHLKLSRRRAHLLFPMFLFLGMYTLRLLDNYYLQNLPMYVPPELAFGIFIGSIVLPAMFLARAITHIDEQSFVVAHAIMIGIFLCGLAFNYSLVIEMVQVRSGYTMLLKLNAISLSSVASSYALFLLATGKVSTKWNVLRIGIVLLLLGVVAITRSRGPLLATIVSLLFYFYFASEQYKKYIIRMLIVIGVATSVATAYFGIDFIGTAFERFFEDESPYSMQANIEDGTGRVGQWIAAWEQFLEDPILGDVVYESYLNFYPHNIILESLISLGVVGTLILFLHLLITTKSGIRLMRDRNSSLIERFSALICIKIFIENQFSGAIWGTPLWIASACVIALAAAKYPRHKQRQHWGGAVFTAARSPYNRTNIQ